MKKTFLSFLLVCGVSTIHSAYAQDACTLTSWMLQQPAHTQLTTESTGNLRDTSVVIGGQSHSVKVPTGFTMSLFATLPGARGLALSPDGVIYATAYSGGTVAAFPDKNGDGVADEKITVATGISGVHGIGFHNNELYVSNPTSLIKLVDKNGDRISDQQVTIINDMPGGGGHTTRNFVFDETKQKIYIQVGSSSNMEVGSGRGIIREYNMDGSAGRVFASGLRNAVGMDIDPRTGALWVNNNGMDNIFGSTDPRHNDNPAECVYLVCDGAHYGWPYAYGFRMRNPSLPAQDQADTATFQTFLGPVAEVMAHSAPLGLHFYRGTSFPSNYRNAVFQAYHGSWNRTPYAPPRITVLWADSDGRNARISDFVAGFHPDVSNVGTRWGRPVSVIEGADGALYFSDDDKGYIYRVQYTAPMESVKPEAQSSAIITGLYCTANPIAADSRIEFSVSTPTKVKVELIDVMGRTVRELVHSNLRANRYTYALGNDLPKGVLYARVTTPTVTKTLTLVNLK